MTTAVRALPVRVPGRVPLAWGLGAYVWLLPFHILVMAFLFGALGWPTPVVRVVAAWKETLLAVLLVLAALRVAMGAAPRIEIRWFDLALAGLAAVGLGYLLGARLWFNAGLPAIAQLYGFRDAIFVTFLYFVGRATPEVVESPKYLRALFAVGVVTSVIAIAERLLIGPELLVLLGAARYVQEFLGAAAFTASNVYGLPDNYWSYIGDTLVRRVGSTYLSSQGFAIPFLIIMPAATLWLTSAGRRVSHLTRFAYGLLWLALLLTVTRMTIVACILQTFVILVARRRWEAVVGGGITAVLGFIMLLVALPGLAGFIWDTLTWQTPSGASHVKDWQEGLDNLLRYPLGVGLGASDQTAVRFGLTPLAADNQYLKFATELGILGLGLYLAVLTGTAVAGLAAWRRGRHAVTRDFGLLVAVTAAGVALNGSTAVVFSSMVLVYPLFWLAGAVATATPGRPAPATVG